MDNENILVDGVESEAKGIELLTDQTGWSNWKQTSYNTRANTHLNGGTAFRGNYAGIGYEWDSTNEIFWSPKPYTSWTKNISTASWEAPVAYPSNEPDGYLIFWTESNSRWEASVGSLGAATKYWDSATSTWSDI